MNDLLKPEKKAVETLTRTSAIDADHSLRKEVRTALGQRLLNTDLKDDKAMSVELPVKLHNLKESFTNFREAENFSYDKGLNEFLKGILKSIHEGLDNCSPEQLHYIPVEDYKEAYTECFDAKIKEMDERYSNISERERFIIYHAQIVRNADQQDLDTFIRNHMGTSTVEQIVLG